MKRSLTLWLMLPILLTLWGVAVWGANADAIWIDEWWTTYYIGAAPYVELSTPLSTIERVMQNRVHENNPVGYYVLLNLWHDAVGRSDVALRLFSGLCSVLAVALIYRLGCTIGGRRVGLAAALILAFSAFYVNYSHELRMYALACLWGAMGLLSYWEFMHRPKLSLWWGAGLLLGAVGLIYTHYGNTLLIVLLGLYHLSVRPKHPNETLWLGKDRRWWAAVGIAVGAGVLFLPHLPITLGIGNRFTEKLVTTDALNESAWPLFDVLRMTIMGFANEQGGFLIVLLTAFVVMLRQPIPSRVREGLIFSGGLALGGILSLLGLRMAFQTLFHVRYMLVVWLPLSLFCALVLNQSLQQIRPQSQRSLAVLLIAAWIAAGLLLSLDIHFHGVYTHPVLRQAFTEVSRWDDLGQRLTHDTRPNDAVVISVGNTNAFAHRGDAEYYLQDISARYLVLEDDQVKEDDFSDFIHGAGRVWLARSSTEPPTSLYQTMEATMQAEGYQRIGEPQTQGNISLSLYVTAPECVTAPQTVIASFGGSAELRYHRATLHDGKLSIWEGWLIKEKTPADTYSIGAYVFSSTNEVSAQADAPLPAPGYTCLLIEMPLPTPDGHLRIGVYDWKNGPRLPLSGTDATLGDNLLDVPIGE